MCRWRSDIARLLSALVCAALWCALPNDALAVTPARYRTVTTTDGLPCDDVQQVMEDSQGFIWAGTLNGVARYDGFRMEVFRSNIRSGDVLCDNSITTMCEDASQRVWIGTRTGLNMYDLRTGEMRRLPHREFGNNVLSVIIAPDDGRLLIGTDQGLYEYFTATDSLVLFTRERSGGVMPQTSVKALMKDSRGNVWIGTWNEGLYRLSPDGTVHAYPRMNERKSAHVIYEDSRHRIWVGSWGEGLFMLRNPYEPERTTWERYTNDPADPSSLSHDIVYSIAEDAAGNLWVGTCRGVGLFDESAQNFDNIYSLGTDTHIQEVTSLMTDRRGMLWISTLGSGATCMSHTGEGLQLDRLDAVRAATGSNNVRCLLIASDGSMWIGIGSNKGLVRYSPESGETDMLSPRDRFAASYRSPISIYSLHEMDDGRIMIGTYDAGLYIINTRSHAVEHFTRTNSPFIGGDRVSDIFRDCRGRYWFGGLPGLGVRLPDGSGCTFGLTELKDAEVTDITEGANGSIWVATQNQGLFRIDGSGNDTNNYSIHQYSPSHGNANSSNISVVYNDPQGRLWMGSNGSGLSLYDYTADRFDCVHLKWDLPGDIISGILSDSNGTLWISTNTGLFSMTPPDGKSDRAAYRLYTKGDGVQDNVFNRGATACDRQGRLYFAGPRGINIIDGKESDVSAGPLPVSITDISISGHHWHELDASQRHDISPEAPSTTSAITLRQSQNNFNVEFAVIDFANDPMQHRYAYMLEGFDKRWNTVDCTHRFAAYSNLPSGRYTLRIKTTDSSGNHTGTERVLKVTVLPPWWASWQAMLLYAAMAGGCALCVWYRRRIRRRKAVKTVAAAAGAAADSEESDSDDTDSDGLSPDEQFLRRATACVTAHLSDTEFSQTAFTEEMGISKSTLFRKLKSITGMTYSSFVRSIRLNTACRLMREKRGIRISELAYSVGFNDPKYFSQCFRKEFGLTPGEYMENLTDETTETPSAP